MNTINPNEAAYIRETFRLARMTQAQMVVYLSAKCARLAAENAQLRGEPLHSSVPRMPKSAPHGGAA